MTDGTIYREALSSKRTVLLFTALSAIFVLLAVWRVGSAGFDVFAGLATFFATFFLFYVINYRRLEISIDEGTVRLKFGVMTWTERLENIEVCEVDVLPWLWRNGGAGVHLMMVEGRYRVSFNFLEHERVVLRLKRKRGPVRDVSFSTGAAEKVVGVVEGNLRG